MTDKASLPLLRDPESVDLTGTVERIVFHNQQNGYTVLRLVPDKAKRGSDPVTCVGHLLSPQAGIGLKLSGRYVNNPRFGRQLAFDEAEVVMPATEDGIRLYLASGLIKGVGEELAGRIVAAFGKDTIKVLDESPGDLLRVRGVGKKSLEQIIQSWAEHRGIRELMLFLQPHGISTAHAKRIFEAYGSDALHIVQKNPWRLSMDIRGIGFPTADQVASKLGFSPESPLRIQACTLYNIQRASDDGHVYLPEQSLVETVTNDLQCDSDMVHQAIASLVMSERLVREEMPLPRDQESPDPDAPSCEVGIYFSRFYHFESRISFYLQRLLNSPRSVRFTDPEKQAGRVVAELPITLAPEQVEAIHTATRNKVMVLTGGPGTGKTTIINAIIRVFESAGARILLAAPTGRAAKRMAETSGHEARTLHRLLEYSPTEEGFARNEDSPLSCGLLVIDEASMMDIQIFYHLLKAVPLGATVVLVGDVHQLPSVGPGTVLADMIGSRVVPVVRLTEIFRQSAESAIICNAHLINRGEIPNLESSRDRLSDFYFIAEDDSEKAAELVVDLVKNHIPRRFGYKPADVQVLTPMIRGSVGVEQLNTRLQEAINPGKSGVQRGERIFRMRDKVMQIRNNYDKDVFNGDMGRISWIDTKEHTLGVNFDERIVVYAFDELDELTPAYAISIHKSQGSEYPAVVIPLMMQHYMLLQRNLVYTGVTRGKKLVVLVGETRALSIAIKNNKTRRRYTRLAWRLNPRLWD